MQQPLSKLFPSIATIIGLCFGMSSIRYALEQRWELSVTLLVVAAFVDGVDGRLARLLNASSKFGAELDSLADFVNFGVAPAFLLYAWSLKQIPFKGVGWSMAIFYTICMSLRLARFNSQDTKKPHRDYFIGIPAPCGAGLTMLPIMLSFQYDITLFRDNPYLTALYMFILAILLTSKLPTLSVKHIKVSDKLTIPTLVGVAIFIIALIIEPWLTLPLLGAIYILSLPCTLYYFHFRQ